MSETLFFSQKNNVYVVYTRWKNLKKTNDMADGQVSYHRPENVRRMNVEKNSTIVRAIEKTRREVNNPDLAQEQANRLREMQAEKKREFKRTVKEQEEIKRQQQAEKEARSYDRIMKEENMSSNKHVAKEDATAAEEYEDDFF
jgi:hypothetical protein